MDALKSSVREYYKGNPKKANDIVYLLDSMEDHGQLSMTLQLDIAEQGRHESGVVNRHLNNVLELASFPMHTVEGFSRAVSAVAAFNLAKGTVKQRVEEARMTTVEANGNYNAELNPPWMNTAWGRVAGQFRKFTMNVFGLLADSIIRYIPILNRHYDAKQVKEARRLLHGLMGMHMLAAAPTL